MKVLKFAILAMCFLSVSHAEAGGVTFDLDQIKTGNGRVYRDILILDSDQYGLLFRHAKGIAKINFDQLSMNLRMLYEPVEEVPAEPPALETDASAADVLAPLKNNMSFTLTARSRVVIPWQSNVGYCRDHCSAYRQAWPRHWSRYHPGLRLAIPECRSLAIDDFLITTGLVPRPPGVNTYRLPYNRPYLLY